MRATCQGGPHPRARHGLPQAAPTATRRRLRTLARQSASSAGDAREVMMSVRRSATVCILTTCRTMGYVHIRSLVVTPVITLLRTG